MTGLLSNVVIITYTSEKHVYKITITFLKRNTEVKETWMFNYCYTYIFTFSQLKLCGFIQMRFNKLNINFRFSNDISLCTKLNDNPHFPQRQWDENRFCFQSTMPSAPHWCPHSKLAINWNATLIWLQSSLMPHWTGKGKHKYIWQKIAFQSASEPQVPVKVTCSPRIPLRSCISILIVFPWWNNIFYYAWKWMGGGHSHACLKLCCFSLLSTWEAYISVMLSRPFTAINILLMQVPSAELKSGLTLKPRSATTKGIHLYLHCQAFTFYLKSIWWGI